MVSVYAEAEVSSHFDVQHVFERLREKHDATVTKAVLLVWFDADEAPPQAWPFEYVEARDGDEHPDLVPGAAE
jgi:hypothetical protein